MFFYRHPKTVYADYAAATPLSENARLAMEPYLSKHFGNPSSIHSFGREAKKAINDTRASIARLLQVQPDEILFTSGGTESNNLAIFGVQKPAKGRTHFITTPIEHGSVLEPIHALESAGTTVTYLPVDSKGRVNKEKLETAILPETRLVSIAYANGEIGTVEKIRALGKVVRDRQSVQPIYFHTDASQAASYLRILPNDMNVDLLTIDSSKIYGPKGVGLLYVRRGTPLSPIFRGGLQERGSRAGTENVAAIVGFGEALLSAAASREHEAKRLAILRDELKKELLQKIPGAFVNGEGEILPHFLNICIPGADAEFLGVKLDTFGIAVSSASACRSISGKGSSYVIEALPGRIGCGASSLRISLGRNTTRRDILAIVDALIKLALQ